MKRMSVLLTCLFTLSCSTSPKTVAHRESRGNPRASATRPGARGGTKARGQAPQAAPSGVSSAEAEELGRAVENERQGKYLDALKNYLNLSINSPASQQEGYRVRALEILNTRLNEQDLREVAGSSDYGFLRGHTLFQLGQMSLDRRDTDSARRYFLSVVSFLPGTDLAQKAQETLSQLESIKYVEPKTIGVVLPLSGKNQAVGQRALRGIELGLGLNDPTSPFKLAVMDSEGNPDSARRGVERLVKEDNVIAVIGSLLSKTAPAEVAKANELGVPTITLSQKAGITEIGPTVFRNAITSEMQVRELVRTAMEGMGLRRFAILMPNDAYGTEFANIFWDEVLARGGTITAAQVYNPKETDFRSVAQRLVGTWYVEGRKAEFDLLNKDQAQANAGKRRGQRQEKSPDDLLPPIVDFDAVFIPDSAKMMSQMAAFLSYVGLRNVRLLGTNLWNTPGVGKKAGLFTDRLAYVESVSFDSPEAKNSRFVTEYQKAFNEAPSVIELQAYDSALILRSLISDGASTRERLTQRLTDLKRFPGALGTLTMSPQREIRRPLMTYVTGRDGNAAPFRREVVR